MWGATTLRELAVSCDHPAVTDMLRSCPRLTSLALSSVSSVVAALAVGFPRAAGSNVGATFGAALHTLQLAVGPDADAELDALVAGLPQLRALALGDCDDTVTVGAWRRNLLVLLGRLEVLEFADAGYNAFSGFNALAGPDSGEAAATSRSCLAHLPIFPLRALALASKYVNGDAAAFIAAIGQQQAQSRGSGGLVELRLSEVTPETWLAAPATVTHLRLEAPHLNEPQLVTVLDVARLPRLRVLELASCHGVFPFDVVYRNAPFAPTVALSPLKETSHPALRRLVLECFDTIPARETTREAWMAAILGPSKPSGAADGPVRFPRLRHAVMNGVALRGWPSHDPFVPAPRPAQPDGILHRLAATLAWTLRR
jgi:hypothetical protein